MQVVVKVLAPVCTLLLVIGCGRADVGGLGGGLRNDGGGGSDGQTQFDGSNRDFGFPPGDSGPIPRDGGPIPRDSGPNPIDSGPNPIDSGPIPTDGGGGPDVGPPPPDGGNPQRCRNTRECYENLGPPPPCFDTPGLWQCRRGQCILECQPPQCNTDCDCPEQEACIAGSCRPANRRNECCFYPNCPEGESCVNPDGSRDMCPSIPPPFDAGVPDGGPNPVDGGPNPVDGGPPPVDAGPPPMTPVGAACMIQGPECQPGFCIDEQSGFPGGYCSEACMRQGGGQSTCGGDAVCANFGQGQNFCLDGCVNNSECRMDYACVQLGILPSRVCYPTPPGSGNPNGAPVGGACTNTNDCVTGTECLQFQGWPGGYCTVTSCDPVNRPCPASSACYNFPSLFSLCLADCPNGGAQSTCRNGYYCFGPSGQAGGCLPN